LKKLFGIVVLLVLANAISSANAEVTEAKAAEAAEVGDDVAVRYAGATILCANENDAAQLYLAGEVALAQAMRVEQSVWRAVSEESAARKEALRRLHSCEWAPRGLRYRIEQKRIKGPHVQYCLRPSGSSSCWWLIAKGTSYSPFNDITRPTP
jgi:hypothetical protein